MSNVAYNCTILALSMEAKEVPWSFLLLFNGGIARYNGAEGNWNTSVTMTAMNEYMLQSIEYRQRIKQARVFINFEV